MWCAVYGRPLPLVGPSISRAEDDTASKVYLAVYHIVSLFPGGTCQGNWAGKSAFQPLIRAAGGQQGRPEARSMKILAHNTPPPQGNKDMPNYILYVLFVP